MCGGRHACSCHDAPDPRLEGSLAPCLLLLLKKEPAHGYELVERIKAVELLKAFPDPGVIYRYLRRLEDMGMLESRLEPGSGGPARRVYSITPEGEDYLKAWVASLREVRDALDSFIMTAEKDLKQN